MFTDYDSIVECVAQHADETPDRCCLADAKNALTYQQAWNAICGLSSHLSESYSAGQYVLVECNQRCEYIIWMLAMHLSGIVAVPLEKNVSMGRLAEIAEETNAVCLAARKRPKDVCIDLPFEAIDSVLGYQDSAPLANPVFPKGDDVAEILFSTGTTGKSKGIVITHSNNIAIAENVVKGVQMKPDNVEIIPMPLSHSHGLRRTYSNLANGSTAVFVDGVLALAKMFDLMDRFHVTSMDISPSILSIVFKLSKDRIGDYADVLDYVQLGSSPLDEDNKARIKKLLPKTRLYNFYGSTEAGCSCLFDFSSMQERPHCVGKECVNAHFIVVDKERRPIEASSYDNPGYIASSGPINMKCYFNAPELTAKTMADGYIYTNDLGYIDSEGFIYMLGREDDVINYGGVKISPEEIESAVVKSPIVRDCACVPMDDPLTGQAPKLFIALENGAEYDFKAFKTFLSQALDASKQPKVVEVIEEIPRTFNGKIRRKELFNR